MAVTPRFRMPLLFAGQAAKEETHNEALLICDALLSPRAVARQADPPATAQVGEMWIVAAMATGDWQGQDDRLALWSPGGWRFIAPVAGQTCMLAGQGEQWRFDGTGWLGPAQAPTMQGGSVVDTEARAAVLAVIALLRDVGICARP